MSYNTAYRIMVEWWRSATGPQWLCVLVLALERLILSSSIPSLLGQKLDGLRKVLLPTPALLSPSHISITDLHDHQPDVLVLCLVQLVHQLPIITLQKPSVRPDLKCVSPSLT